MSEEKVWDRADKTQQAIDELYAKLKAVEVAVHELVAAVESASKDGTVNGDVLYEVSCTAVELGWELDALDSDEDDSSVDWDDDDDDEDEEDFYDSPLGWSDGDEDDWDDDIDDEDWNESEWDEDDGEDDEDEDDDGDAGLSSGVIGPRGNSGQSRIVNLCEGDVRKWGGLAS